MKMGRYILVLLVAIMSLMAWGQAVPADTVQFADTVKNMNKFEQIKQRARERIEEKMNEPYDTVRDSGYWWRAMKHGKVDMDGGTIDYPAFIDFSWKVYKWGDRTFNSYDSSYVVGTGKNWKLMLKYNNWIDAYAGEPIDKTHIFVRSGLTTNVGIQLSFMAVSVGYTIGVSNLIHGKKTSNKIDFSFTCARFAADAYYMENNGSTKMRYWRHGQEKEKGTVDGFEGLHRKAYGMSAYYFFNNHRYAQAAAYCFSKYQKRSAGSLIAGFCIQHRDMSFDAQQFPEIVRQQLPEGVEMPRFLYNDYCLMVGYGHNWVLSKRWLLNLTVLPYTGYRHMIATDHDDSASRWSVNMRGRIGAVYNHKKYYIGLQGYTDIHEYKTDNFFFTGSLIDFTALIGIRF